jgi:crossover junction endodeoxyribonuclease RusA
MREVTLELPYPPSDNHYKRPGRLCRTKTGKVFQRRVNTDQTKRFYLEVCSVIRSQGVKSFDSAPITLKVLVYPPDNRKRDIGNLMKVLSDSLQRGGLFDDDFQICGLWMVRCETMKPGKVVVRISELEEKA